MDTSHKKKFRRIKAKTCEAIITSSDARKKKEKKKFKFFFFLKVMFDFDAREIDAMSPRDDTWWGQTDNQ